MNVWKTAQLIIISMIKHVIVVAYILIQLQLQETKEIRNDMLMKRNVKMTHIVIEKEMNV